jgi:hypothetical protein
MQGQLFTQDFLTRGVLDTPPYQSLGDSDFSAFKAALQGIFAGFSGASKPNEAQTENDIINKVLLELGYVDDAGQVLPPFVWNEEERRARLSALDALFFWLYGLNADDAGYIMDSFPIVREHDEKAFGRFRTKDDVLARLQLLTA